jgi:PIN domain nuclease of toxin-antitoxin system
LGRLELDATWPEFFEAALAADVRVIELSPEITAKTNDLSSDFQGDPFDRTIAATAAVLSLTLITTDPAMRISVLSSTMPSSRSVREGALPQGNPDEISPC